MISRLDTSDIGGCGDVIGELADRLGGVDVFVNNAGTGSATLALEMTLERWRHVVATDLDGAFACLQAAARGMVAAGNGGRLIAVTSVHEHQPRVGSAAYDAARQPPRPADYGARWRVAPRRQQNICPRRKDRLPEHADGALGCPAGKGRRTARPGQAMSWMKKGH